MTERTTGRALLTSLVLALLTLALYARTAAPGLLPGDAGEFQMAAWLGGLAHPTGYPLYLLLGWLWTHLLPIGDPAYRLNLFSAFWAAATVGLLVLLLRRVGRRLDGRATPWPLAIAAALAITFAVTPTFWSQATRAEVYALNAFFVTLILWLCLSPSGRPRGAWCALVFGLSLTHHRTMALFLPAMLAYFLLTGTRPPLTRRRFTGLITLAALPQLLYLYIPLRAAQTPYLHLTLAPGRDLTLYANTLPDFLAMISGSVFRGSLGTAAQGLGRVSLAFRFLNDQFTPLGIAVGLLGIAVLVGRRDWALLALTGLGFLAVVGFGLIYFIGDISDLFVPAYLVWTIWMAVGLNALAVSLRSRVVIGLVIVLALLPVYLLWTGFPQRDQSGDRRARERWEAILAQPVADNAILVSNDRNEMVPLWYLQNVEGRRPDILGLFPLITPDPQYANVVRLLDSLLDAGRPLLLIKPMPGLEIKYRLMPAGERLVEVLGPRTDDGRLLLLDLSLNEAMTLRGYAVRPHDLRAGATLTMTLVWEPQASLAVDYASYVHLLAGDGQTIAQSDHQPGGVFYPTTLWQPREYLWDDHVLALPAKLPTGPYELRAGLYHLATMERLGREIVIGQVSAQSH